MIIDSAWVQIGTTEQGTHADLLMIIIYYYNVREKRSLVFEIPFLIGI